ncbi:MAG: replication initiation protein [Pseudomonadota bacterium]
MITEKKELKKHVATIHCSNSLSLLQRKISNALLFHAYPHLLEQEEYKITVTTLCKIIGYYGHNYEVIKSALRELISTVIEWNVIDETRQSEDWTASTILASVHIKAGECYYAYSPRMKKLLYSPTMYGKINLIIQAKFKSSYGLALYENCVRYQGLKATRWFEYDVFRHLMGVPKQKYQVFRDFKKRVLDKSIDELNTYSNLIVDVEIKRQGRKVIALRFNLKERGKKHRLGKILETKNDLAKTDNQLINQLVSQFRLQEKQIGKLLNTYQSNQIKTAIDFTFQHPHWIKGKIKNPAGFLISVLRGEIISNVNYQVTNRSIPEKNLNKELATKQAYDQLVKTMVNEAYENLTQKVKIQQQQEFINDLKQGGNHFILQRFQKNGFADEMVQANFRNFLMNYYATLLPKLPSLEEFKQQNTMLE